MEITVIVGVLGKWILQQNPIFITLHLPLLFSRNIVAALLFLSPLSTFWRIIKNRSTEAFESIPYIVLLLNATLWTYYGSIKPDVLLVTIIGFGSLLMVVYLSIFLTFAPSKIKIRTAVLVAVVNVGVLVAAILGTRLTMRKRAQVNTISLLCHCVTVFSFASPLKTVVTKRSVEFMPFWLTFFFFLVGTTWSTYALLVYDLFILIPSSVGFLLGVIQLVLYAWYSRYPAPAIRGADENEHLLHSEDL